MKNEKKFVKLSMIKFGILWEDMLVWSWEKNEDLSMKNEKKFVRLNTIRSESLMKDTLE